MKYQLLTRKKVDLFIELGMLNDEQIKVLETRVKGYSVVRQSLDMNVSVSTINRIRKTLDEKLNIVERDYPDIFG